jgi:hypothetical protein
VTALDFPSRATLQDWGLNAFPRMSFRYWPRGGAARTAPVLTPGDLLLRRNEMIFLIHGFNVAEDAAFAGYRSFLHELGDPWVEMATAVYWPGDSREKDPDREAGWTYWFTRYTSYLGQPKRARMIGRAIASRLADAVDNRKQVAFANARLIAAAEGRDQPDFRDMVPPVLTLHIVAHSMGCRLTLELLDHLIPHLKMPGHARDEHNRPIEKPIQVKLVVLMAAAIPNYLLVPGGERKEAFESPEDVRVHWSTRDVVLLGAFPLGQFFESDEPHMPFSGSRSALGRTGTSQAMRLENERHGHGKYWTNRTISRSVAKALEKFHPERVGIARIARVAPSERPQPAPRRRWERDVSERDLRVA